VVNARREAVLRLRVRGTGGIELDVDAIIDTGFTGFLTLPSATVATLGLVRHSSSSAVLADGSVSQYDICSADVEWGGAWRSILVSGVGRDPLIGMRLLADHRLIIDVAPGGIVEIIPRP